jgi:cobalt-zinc-cadmium resistance protein CzcA
VREVGRKLSGEEIKELIADATIEIRQAAGFGQLIIVIVFLPIFGLVGIEGKMFKPMAATFAIAVFAALVLSFTTAPALASLLLSGSIKDKEPKAMQWLRRLYQSSLAIALMRKKLVMAVAGASVVVGGVLFAMLGGEFLPQLSEGSYAFHMIRPVNVGITKSVEFQRKADEIVKSFPEVKWTFSRIGTSEVATDPMGVNVSDSYIMLKDKSEWPKVKDGQRRTKEELVADIIAKLEKALPGMRYLASQPIQMRFNELLEGTRADVTVKVFGPDLKTLVELGQKLQGIIAKVPGAGDVEVDIAGTSPVLRVNPKTGVLNRYGIRKNEVLETVSVALGGEEVGNLYEGERRFPIVVRLDEEKRADIDAIRALPVGVGGNATVPLSEVADMKFTETYGVINREDSNRRTAVMINLRGRDTESFVTEARALVEKEVQMPQGYYVQWGGNFKNLQEARSRLLILTPLALTIVLMMIYAAFKSVGQT